MNVCEPPREPSKLGEPYRLGWLVVFAGTWIRLGCPDGERVEGSSRRFLSTLRLGINSELGTRRRWMDAMESGFLKIVFSSVVFSHCPGESTNGIRLD